MPYKYCITFVDIIPFRFGCIFIYFPRPRLSSLHVYFQWRSLSFFRFHSFRVLSSNFFGIRHGWVAFVLCFFASLTHKNAIKRGSGALHVATLFRGLWVAHAADDVEL
jgi:hypothetical protein